MDFFVPLYRKLTVPEIWLAINNERPPTVWGHYFKLCVILRDLRKSYVISAYSYSTNAGDFCAANPAQAHMWVDWKTLSRGSISAGFEVWTLWIGAKRPHFFI